MRRFTHERSFTCDAAHYNWMRLCDTGGYRHRNKRSPCMTTHAAAVPEAELPPLTGGPYRKRIGLISVVACFGGLLFGYDTGVANGAEGPMAKELGLSLLQLGVVISSLIFAAAVGALIMGRVSDSIGRRKTILILAVLFFVGVLFVVLSPAGPEPGTFSATGFGVLVTGRIILGLAVGGASTV